MQSYTVEVHQADRTNADPSFPEDFVHVADIAVSAEDPQQAMEYAFALAQGGPMCGSWWNKQSATPRVDRARSTMIGDVFKIEDQPYYIDCDAYRPL